MSRNKDIKFMHDVTGLSYKVCRQKLKDHHWNLWQAIGYDEMFQFISEKIPELCNDLANAINSMVDVAKDMIESFADVISSIDIEQLKQYQTDSKGLLEVTNE